MDILPLIRRKNITFRKLKDVVDGEIFRYNKTWAKKDNYSFFSWKHKGKSYCEQIFDHKDKVVATINKPARIKQKL